MNDASNLPPETDDDESAGNLPPAAPKAAAKTKAAAKPKAAAAPAQKATSSGEIITAEQSERVKIILEENDNIPPTGLFIGINGRSFLLRAGEECLVPKDVLGVLDDAVEEVPRVGSNNNVVEYRKKMRFPYRIVR